ncbi:hypothetical protein [Catenovulum maritimum]|uniref:Methyl-accepting transducer domain-containing protein n=1 Tax=Catenovulum maritimum TaxID=1513271 RepID=A0A0J8GYP7_9ALTE|nr:hypothetical protein [Catenovulum maritimum]KMT66359.1 hypothetical protein XM47_03765 [Catenovulum maritimum]
MALAKSPVFFVVSAQISAHLYSATKIAEKLSLTAKNARAITARAGQVAVGFAAITGFIQELAISTISLAQSINMIAIKISMVATQLERAQQAQLRFENVISRSSDAQYIDSIRPMLKQNQGLIIELNQRFNKLISELSSLLDETAKQIRSASVISSMSKIEASQSGQYQNQLEVISENIDTSAQQIKSELNKASQLLSNTDRKTR